MATMNLQQSGHSYEWRCDQIETTSMYPPTEPDPTWEETDSHGHVHTHATKGTTWHTTTYDTLNGDGYDDTYDEHACLVCDDEISPRYIPVPGWSGGYRTFRAGDKHYYRNGAEITEAQFKAETAGFHTEHPL